MSGVETRCFLPSLSLKYISVEMVGNEAEMKPVFYASCVAIYVSKVRTQRVTPLTRELTPAVELRVSWCNCTQVDWN